MCSLECPFILPNTRANDVGRLGVERGGVGWHFSPRDGIVILVRFDTGELFPVGKKTASNIVGLSCSTRYPVLPNVRYDRVKVCYDLPNTVEFLPEKKARKKAPERRYKVRRKIESHPRGHTKPAKNPPIRPRWTRDGIFPPAFSLCTR